MPLGKYVDTQADRVEESRRVWQVKYKVEKYLKKFPRKNALCVVHCGHINVNDGIVAVNRSVSGRVKLVGVSHCNRLWACPICAAIIQCKRAFQLRLCILDWCMSKNSCIMVTLTYRGDRQYKLDDLISRFGLARKYFFELRRVKEYFNSISIGRCYCLEMTVSDLNGWHVHVHILIFCIGRNVDEKEVKDTLYPIWYSCLLRVGLDCDYEHGVNVKSSMTCSEYVTKMSGELSLGNVVKVGRVNHFTPFQLVLDGSSWSDRMFGEYLDCTYRRNALVYSRNLKDYFGLNDMDEDVDVYKKKMDEEFSVCFRDYENLTYTQKAFLSSDVSKDEKIEYLLQNGIRPFDYDG